MSNRTIATEARQSGGLDAAVFVATIATGIAAYFAMRLWLPGRSQATTLTLLVLMVAYATVVSWIPKLRVRRDQAGDNVYYLGLLFTLASMGFALYDFGTATEQPSSVTAVRQIISNFGIALATTIVGILLRVALHQMRVDPADLEMVTRIELTEAAERLRGTMDTITVSFGRFHQELQQRSSDLNSELIDQSKAAVATVLAQAAAETTRLVTENADAHKQILDKTRALTETVVEVATVARGAAERLRAVEPPPLLLSKRFEKVAAVLEQVATQTDRTANSFSVAGAAACAAGEGMARATTAVDGAADKLNTEHVKAGEQLASVTRAVTESLGTIGTRLTALLGQVGELETQSKRSAEETQKAQQGAADVLRRLTELTRHLTTELNSAERQDHVRS